MKVVANNQHKLENGLVVRDGEEFNVRSQNEEVVFLNSGFSSFSVSHKEFENLFDVVPD